MIVNPVVNAGGGAGLVTGTIQSADKYVTTVAYSDGVEGRVTSSSEGELITISCLRNSVIEVTGDSTVSLAGGIEKITYGNRAYFVYDDFSISP